MRKVLIYILLLVSAVTITAQTSYFCDFEDASERSQWHLNSLKTGAALSTLDQWWFIGQAGNCGATGQNGLFISYDSVSACYKGSNNNWTTAYRDITLTPGQYTIRFDWFFQGKNADKIVVAWVPTSNKCLSGTGAALPTAINSYIIGATQTLRGKSAWTPFSATFNVTAATQPGRLVFYFFSTQGGATNPAAAIDNIEITNQACSTPLNLQYNAKTGTLGWSGSGTNYDVRYYSYQAGVWHEQKNVSGRALTLTLTEEGYTYFYVRQVCDSANNVHSNWAVCDAFVYIPGKRCIEYLDIGNKVSNAGKCYESNYAGYTSALSPNGTSVDAASPSLSGRSDVEHVLHTDPNEIDPNTTTAGGLKTVPEGEIASVRLGAYTSSGNSSRIIYKYTVQAGMSDLLILKYAPVLLSGGHSESENPRFKLEILDGNGQVLSSSCTQADFKAGFGDTKKWHNEGDLYWSDWQKITVSLRQYVGQTLTIRLTSIRCTYDTHYAYAYFTLGCESGDFQGLSCGDFATDHFTAPDGFNYRWKSTKDPSGKVLSTEQTYNISQTDTTIYTVDMVSKTDPNCYYVLTANPNPRFPVVQAVATPKMVDCQNYVDFSEDSYISIINRVNGNVMERSQDEAVQSVMIDYGDGSAPEDITDNKKSTHKFPAAGGTFHVKVTASMNEGVCTNDTTITLHLPDLSPAESSEERQWCRSQGPMVWKGKKYNENFVDTTVYKSPTTGCDSLHLISFRFVDETSSESFDTICSNAERGYIFFGEELRKEGKYVHRMENAAGCDSVITLNLHVNPELVVATEGEYVLCADDPVWVLPFERLSGDLIGVELDLCDPKDTISGLKQHYYFAPGEPVAIPFDSALRAGVYCAHIRFLSPWCGNAEANIMLTVLYERSILEQFVGQGFFSVHNERYNGDYMITGFQWLRNGEPIPGQNQSYIYVPSDLPGTEYTCLLTNADGLTLPACPLFYGINTALSDLNASGMTLNEAMMMVQNGQATMQVYDTSGRLMGSEVPDSHGIYLLRVVTKPDNRIVSFKLIR